MNTSPAPSCEPTSAPAVADASPTASPTASPQHPLPPLLIGLTGAAGSGKDTVAHHLRAEFGFEHIAFADPIVDMLSALFEAAGIHEDWMTERALKELPTPLGWSFRHLAQTLGTEWGRGLDPALWLKVAEHALTSAHLSDENVVISDVRFANEAAFIRQRGGFVVRVHRQADQLAAVRQHASETEAATIAADAELFNHGSKATLHDQIDRLVFALRRRPPAAACGAV